MLQVVLHSPLVYEIMGINLMKHIFVYYFICVKNDHVHVQWILIWLTRNLIRTYCYQCDDVCVGAKEIDKNKYQMACGIRCPQIGIIYYNSLPSIIESTSRVRRYKLIFIYFWSFDTSSFGHVWNKISFHNRLSFWLLIFGTFQFHGKHKRLN